MSGPDNRRDVAAARRASAAARARRHYERKRAGLRVVRIEIDEDTLSGLAARELISTAGLRDPNLLIFELGELLDAIAAEGRVKKPHA